MLLLLDCLKENEEMKNNEENVPLNILFIKSFKVYKTNDINGTIKFK